MKKIIILLFAIVAISFNQVKAVEKAEKMTAEQVLTFAGNFDKLNAENAKLIKAAVKKLTLKERARLYKLSYKMVKEAEKTADPLQIQKAKPGLYVLAVFAPPLAVGIHTEWKIQTVYSVLWTMLGWAPGVIHAFIVLGR